MIIKEIKEYSKRLRINIVNADGFQAGEKVILLSQQEYDNLIHQADHLNELYLDTKTKLDYMHDQETNFDDMMEKVTANIDKRHDKEIGKKEEEIKQLTDELNALKNICSKFNMDISQLSAIDILFRKKHHDLIQDFHNSIWISNQEDIITADVDQLPGKDNEK